MTTVEEIMNTISDIRVQMAVLATPDSIIDREKIFDLLDEYRQYLLSLPVKF